MADIRVPAAGWYPDPHNPSSERWWDGASWTANARPLNPAPPRAPQPPVPAAGALPGAGWYENPQDDTEETWFDGAAWTQFTRQRADQPSDGVAGLPGLLGSISDQMQQVTRAGGGQSPCPWVVGQSVTVAYDPVSPAQARIPTSGMFSWFPWIFVGAGAFVVVGSLFSLLRSVAEVGLGGFLLVRMWRRRKAATTA